MLEKPDGERDPDDDDNGNGMSTEDEQSGLEGEWEFRTEDEREAGGEDGMGTETAS